MITVIAVWLTFLIASVFILQAFARVKIGNGSFFRALAAAVLYWAAVSATYIVVNLPVDIAPTWMLYTALGISVVLVFTAVMMVYRTSFFTGFLVSFAYGVTTMVLMAIIIAPLRLYVMSWYIVEGRSMEPTFSQEDVVLMNKMDRTYEVGEVIVFYNEHLVVEGEERSVQISRIAHVPGETYTFKGEQHTLSANEYFVLGDAPDRSLDSRSFGPIKESDILGTFITKLP